MRRTRTATVLHTALDAPVAAFMVAVVAILVATAPSPATAVTGDGRTPTASEQLTPASGLLFGAFVGKQEPTTDVETSVSAFEQEIGRKLDLVRFYVRWDTPPDAGQHPAVRRTRPHPGALDHAEERGRHRALVGVDRRR
jgi:hypothetical protein